MGARTLHGDGLFTGEASRRRRDRNEKCVVDLQELAEDDPHYSEEATTYDRDELIEWLRNVPGRLRGSLTIVHERPRPDTTSPTTPQPARDRP